MMATTEEETLAMADEALRFLERAFRLARLDALATDVARVRASVGDERARRRPRPAPPPPRKDIF